MSKYCPKCNKIYKKEYSKFCPKCMEELEFIYSNQSKLDSYNAKLNDFLKELASVDEDIYKNKILLDKSVDGDEMIEYKFKIVKLTERKVSLENNIEKTQKSIKKEEKLFEQEKREIKRKEILYMRLYSELSDVMIENLCDYFMMKPSSRDKTINKLVGKYSENAINDAMNIIEEEIEEELERKRQYDALMKTLDKKDVQLLCREFSIDNPSKPKIVNYLIDNYSLDEIDILKLEVYRKEQQRKKEQERQNAFNELSSKLNNDSIGFLSRRLSLRNHSKTDLINHLIDNYSKREINDLIKICNNVQKFKKIVYALKTDLSLDNLPTNLKKSAISWYKKGKNGESDFVDYYKDINRILKSDLSCSSDKLNVRLDKLVVQFEFNSDLKTVSRYSGLYESTIEGYYKQGRKGDFAYKKFYDKVSKLNTDLKKFDVSKQDNAHEENDSIPSAHILESIIREMKKGLSIYDAGMIFGIGASEINRCYNLGRRSHSPETVKFYKEINSIERKKKENMANNAKPNFVNSPSRARGRTDGEKERDREKMKEIIDLMKKGYSRNEAAKKAGIYVGLIVMWNRQGSNGEGEDAINFHEQLTRIEKSK